MIFDTMYLLNIRTYYFDKFIIMIFCVLLCDFEILKFGLTLKEESRLRVFGNTVLRRTFALERK